MDTIEARPVLEQLAEAEKWWNADEAEEPDVRRLFAACKAEIEHLQREQAHAQAVLERIAQLALADIRARSEDIHDYLEMLEYIVAIARGLKGRA